jgi:hypothetical protein
VNPDLLIPGPDTDPDLLIPGPDTDPDPAIQVNPDPILSPDPGF